MSSIQIRDLFYKHRSGTFQLSIESLDIPTTASTAIIGPSGSGKTTLLNLISGILPLKKGTLTVDGVALNRMADHERRSFRINNIGFVFQDFELIDYLTCYQNIYLPCRLNKALKKKDVTKESITATADKLGLKDKLNRYPHQISQGEMQRVAIARALVTAPKMILADEPTGNLDPDNKQAIVKLLLSFAEQQSSGLLMVTHDHSLLEYFGNVIDFTQFHQEQSNG